MKRISSLFSVLLLLCATLLTSGCISRIVWNNSFPQKTIDCYVKTGDLNKGQSVYRDSQGFYVELNRRLRYEGPHYTHSFPAAYAQRPQVGDIDDQEIVQIPASFAQYLLGNEGSSVPTWMAPKKTSDKLRSCGEVVRTPQHSVTLFYQSTNPDVHTGKNIPFYVLFGFPIDASLSAIGTGVCIAVTPIVFLIKPSALYNEEHHPIDTPDHLRVGLPHRTTITHGPKDYYVVRNIVVPSIQSQQTAERLRRVQEIKRQLEKSSSKTKSRVNTPNSPKHRRSGAVPRRA